MKVFELELVFKPMTILIERMGAEVVANFAISSTYHAAGIMPLFRFLSRLRFSQPVEYFKIGSEYVDKGLRDFCDNIEK